MEKERENVPGKIEELEISREEFRATLEKEMPEEVFVQGRYMDDFGSWGTLSFRRADGTRVSVSDYYPTTDAEGNVKVSSLSPVSVLDNLPYKWAVFPGEHSAFAEGRLVRR